jgi:hypothetical protein
MNPAIRRAFLLLIVVQALHSLEEFRFELWRVFEPARAVSRLFSPDPETGFAIANGLLIAFGTWCYMVPVGLARQYAGLVVWLWILFEFTNGIMHVFLSLSSWSYYPGILTAPLLLALASYLAALVAVGADRNGVTR